MKKKKSRNISNDMRVAITGLWIKKSVHKNKKKYTRKTKHRHTMKKMYARTRKCKCEYCTTKALVYKVAKRKGLPSIKRTRQNSVAMLTPRT